MLDKGLPEFEAGQPWEQYGFQLKDKSILPKIAVVGDSIKVRIGAKAIALTTGSDFMTFLTRKLAKAWAWIRT